MMFILDKCHATVQEQLHVSRPSGGGMRLILDRCRAAVPGQHCISWPASGDVPLCLLML